MVSEAYIAFAGPGKIAERFGNPLKNGSLPKWRPPSFYMQFPAWKFPGLCQKLTNKPAANSIFAMKRQMFKYQALITALIIILTATATFLILLLAENEKQLNLKYQEIEDLEPDTVESDDAAVVAVPETSSEIYLTRVANAEYRASPELGQKNVIGRLRKNSEIRKLGGNRDFYFVSLMNDEKVWIHEWFLQAKDPDDEEHRMNAKLELAVQSAGYEPFDAPKKYTVTVPEASLRLSPEQYAETVLSVPGGTALTVYGIDGEFYLCTCCGGLCYVFRDCVAEGRYFASYPNAVDLRQILPDSEFEILFASSNNVSDRALYPAIPLMEQHTAEMLREAYDIFKKDGYTIKVYDAYRPKRAQFVLYDIVRDNRFIADPYNTNSWHQLGRAVDMSLIEDATGEELMMPTPMHTFSTDASRSSYGSWPEEIQRNVDYMTGVMLSVGFRELSTEWWHFENPVAGDVLPIDLDYKEVSFVCE